MRMMLRATLSLPLLLAIAGASAQTPPPVPATTILNRASSTVTGQPLAFPTGPLEVVVAVTEIPAGGALPMHKHPWPRYAIVERGRLRVSYEEAGLVREFGPGEAVIEAVDQWHEGRVIGPDPVRILVVDQVPPGRTNLVAR